MLPRSHCPACPGRSAVPALCQSMHFAGNRDPQQQNAEIDRVVGNDVRCRNKRAPNPPNRKTRKLLPLRHWCGRVDTTILRQWKHCSLVQATTGNLGPAPFFYGAASVLRRIETYKRRLERVLKLPKCSIH